MGEVGETGDVGLVGGIGEVGELVSSLITNPPMSGSVLPFNSTPFVDS